MKLDFDRMIENPKGGVFKDGEQEICLGDFVYNCLQSMDPRDPDTAAKMKRGRIAIKLANNGVVEVSAEEIATMKEAVEKYSMHPVAAVIVLELLEKPISETPTILPPQDTL